MPHLPERLVARCFSRFLPNRRLPGQGRGRDPGKDFALRIVEVDGRGDIAFCRGTYAMTIAAPGAPAPIKDTGKYIEVRRRQKDGSWRIVADIFNSDLPPEK